MLLMDPLTAMAITGIVLMNFIVIVKLLVSGVPIVAGIFILVELVLVGIALLISHIFSVQEQKAAMLRQKLYKDVL